MLSDIEETLINNFNACDKCIRRFVKKPDEKHLKKAKQNRKKCELCNGLLSDKNLLKDVLNRLNEYSVRSFSVGVRVPQSLQSLEDKISLEYGLIDYLPLRKAIKDRVSKFLIKKLSIKQHESADLNIILDLSKSPNKVIISEKKAIYRINFIKNKGAKTLADKCDICGGRGCSVCEWTGKKNDGSFEAYLLYDVPKKLSASKPEIIWPIKDMPELSFVGNGFPVYLIFKNIKERIRGPFLIDFDRDGIKIVSVYEVKSRLALNKPFIVGGTICIEFKQGCSTEILEKIKRLHKILLKGKNGYKIWEKSLEIRKILKNDNFCCFDAEYDSGINFYNLFNVKETSKDKEIIGKPFKEGEVNSFSLELSYVDLPY
ncbi:MAG: hypothetical protein ACP5SE_02540 [Nitrososphaeria archaeon]